MEKPIDMSSNNDYDQILIELYAEMEVLEEMLYDIQEVKTYIHVQLDKIDDQVCYIKNMLEEQKNGKR
jgi:hypothetical protein